MKRIRLDDQSLPEVLVGHHVDMPKVNVYARIGEMGRLEIRMYKQQAPARPQSGGLKSVVCTRTVVALDKGFLLEAVLKG